MQQFVLLSVHRSLTLPALFVLGFVLSAATPAHAQTVSAGFNHTCAIKSDNTVGCWGNGNDGELGDGFSSDRRTVGTVSNLTEAVKVSAGTYYSCALKNDGTVACWGNGQDGKLGNGSTSNAPTPVAVTGLTDVVGISAAARHMCALKDDGTVACWGWGGFGHLGLGNTSDSMTPATVPGLTGAVSLSAGDSHTCAARNDGSVTCWGANTSGQLGDGGTTNSSSPVAVTGLTDAVSVSAGSNFACALKRDGTVACWGSANRGQLGDGGTTDSSVPVAVTGLAGARQLSAGGNHACAVKNDDTVACWGYGEFGQLGFGGTPLEQPTPVQVTGLTNAVSVEAGAEHTCAVRSDSTVVCWGSGDDGRLGDGQKSQRNFPVAVQFLTVTGVEDQAAVDLPSLVVLTPSPNPATDATTLRFALPSAGAVRIEVFNVLGQRVAALVDGIEAAGPHTLPFDTAALAPGVYIVRVQTGDQVRTQPFTVAR